MCGRGVDFTSRIKNELIPPLLKERNDAVNRASDNMSQKEHPVCDCVQCFVRYF